MKRRGLAYEPADLSVKSGPRAPAQLIAQLVLQTDSDRGIRGLDNELLDDGSQTFGFATIPRPVSCQKSRGLTDCLPIAFCWFVVLLRKFRGSGQGNAWALDEVRPWTSGELNVSWGSNHVLSISFA